MQTGRSVPALVLLFPFQEGTRVSPPGKPKSCVSQAWVTPTPGKVVVLTSFLGLNWSLHHHFPVVHTPLHAS